jgi:16S rRNA (cytosine967-C5)-methyltransferase
LGTLLSSRLEGSGLERRDRAFVTELVQGTVRMKLTLDWFIAPFSRRPLDSLDPVVLWSLRLAAYQAMFTAVPDYAAVDMAVSSAASASGKGSSGFVNAVMRAFVVGAGDVAYPDRETDPIAYLEIRYSHPRWVVEMWIDEMGFEETERVCAADNVGPPVSLRTNLLRTSRSALARSLEEKGVEVTRGRLTPECLLIKGSGPPGDLDEFEQGLFSVQDEASQLVGHCVSVRPGMRVLDMCAAPGGKANHIAELARNDGEVLAVDINPARLAMVEESAQRLGNGAVRTMVMDATGARETIEGTFDRVLLDAPCSGLGTLARRPDARWRRGPSDIDRLVELQATLMSAAAKMLKPSGLLVYSTCTISRRENEGVVDMFLSSEPDFRAVPVTIEGREVLPCSRILPEPGEHDGMFVCALAAGG